MAAPTITQIITQIAPISEILASNDVSRGALFGAPINSLWPVQIYVETQSCRFRYDQEDVANGSAPSSTLVKNTNYLYSIICGKYGQTAFSLIQSGGVVPGTGSSTVVYSIPIQDSYTATTDGETVLPVGLPEGARVFQVVKGQPLDPDDFSYVSPNINLLNGISMGADEVIFFLYVVPI